MLQDSLVVLMLEQKLQQEDEQYRDNSGSVGMSILNGNCG